MEQVDISERPAPAEAQELTVNRVAEERSESEGLMDQVKFLSVRQAYPKGEDIVVSYRIDENVKTTSHDWVGVYKVGWTLPKNDYYTFVWSPPNLGEDRVQTVTFTPRYLPTDQQFYQFCYVTKVGEIRGVSSPFQIRDDFSDDDLECVELNDEVSDVVLVQTRERRVREQETESRLVDLQTTVASLQVAGEDWKAKAADLSEEKTRLVAELDMAKGRISELEGRVAAHIREIDVLCAEKADATEQTRESAAMVSAIEARLASVVAELSMCGDQAASAITERKKLEQQLEEEVANKHCLEVQVSDLESELTSAKMRLADSEEDMEKAACSIDDCMGQISVLKEELELKRNDAERLETALDIANDRKASDDLLLTAKDAEITELQKRLLDTQSCQMDEMNQLAMENSEMREQLEQQNLEIKNRLGELAAVRMTLDDMDTERQRLTGLVSEAGMADSVATSNLAELMGENNILKNENADLRRDVERLTAQLQEHQQQATRNAGSGGDAAAMFGLRRAFEDAQRKSEEACAAHRQQVRVARAAEATVRVLEAEIEGLNDMVKMLKGKLQEGAEHYRSKYRECTLMKRKLDMLEQREATTTSDADEMQRLRAALAESEEQNEAKSKDIDQLEIAVAAAEEEVERLKVASCRTLMQSLRIDASGALPTNSSAPPTTAEATNVPPSAGTNPPEPVELTREPRLCPVCNVELPWAMAIEAVHQHCAAHFESLR